MELSSLLLPRVPALQRPHCDEFVDPFNNSADSSPEYAILHPSAVTPEIVVLHTHVYLIPDANNFPFVLVPVSPQSAVRQIECILFAFQSTRSVPREHLTKPALAIADADENYDDDDACLW